MNAPTGPSGVGTDALERDTGFGWGWFTVLGATLVVLGALALLNLPPAATGSVRAVGLVMVIGAFAQLGTMLLVPNWRGIGLLVLGALFYGAAGVLAIVNPGLAATPLTLLLASALICAGAMRIRLSSVMPSLPGRHWVAASGVVSVLSGLAFIPLSFAAPVRLPAMALAFDLTFQGTMAIMFAVALRRATTSIPPATTEP